MSFGRGYAVSAGQTMDGRQVRPAGARVAPC
jgi:hypothetical protein